MGNHGYSANTKGLVMMTKLTLTIASGFLALGLIGCQGQSPFKGSTDLAKEYPSANQANSKYVPGLQAKLPAAPDNTQNICVSAFKVSVENDRGSRLLMFTEDSSSTYKINVRSFGGANFEIQAERPEDSTFKQISKDGNTATYAFTWKPGKTTTSQVGLKLLSLKYVSAFVQDTCGADAREELNLVVVKTDDIPLVGIKGLPQTEISLGSEAVAFKIEVNDASSTQTSAPKLKGFEFREEVRSGEKVVVDASKAVSCEDSAKLVEGTTWSFNCSFDTKLIKGLRQDKKADKSVDTLFFVTAVSSRSGKASHSTPGYVKVKIPKVEATVQAAPAVKGAKS